MIEYRRATEADIPMLAETHIKCFPDYFLTSLGKKLLCSYYQSFWEEHNIFALAFDGDKMVGFAMGHLYPSEARRNFERKNALRLFFRLLFLCVKLDKPALERCTSRVFKKRSAENHLTFSHQADANALSLGVLEEYRRMHVATQLAAERESIFKEYGVKSFTGSVLKDNHNIQRFLEKQGFSLIEEAGNGLRYIKYL